MLGNGLTPEKLKKKALMTAMRHQGMVPTKSSSPGLSSSVLTVAPSIIHSNTCAFAASARTASLRRETAAARQDDDMGVAAVTRPVLTRGQADRSNVEGPLFSKRPRSRNDAVVHR